MFYEYGGIEKEQLVRISANKTLAKCKNRNPFGMSTAKRDRFTAMVDCRTVSTVISRVGCMFYFDFLWKEFFLLIQKESLPWFTG
jgi:hypothetical protein